MRARVAADVFAHPLVLMVLSACGFCAGAPAVAQSHLGTDFWTADLYNNGPPFTIAIGNPDPVPVNITIFNTIEGTTLDTVPPMTVKTYTFPGHDLFVSGTVVSTDPVYHVTSVRAVAVFVFDPLQNSAFNDAALALPVPTLRKRHRIANFVNSVNSAGQLVGVVAASPGTTNVQILDDNQTVVNNVSLTQGQFFQRVNGIFGATPADDMTGWEVVTDRPAAVLSGSYTSVGPGCCADAIFEQLLGENKLSLGYVVAPTGTRPLGCTVPSTCAADLFRFVATQNNTTLVTTPNVGGGTLNEADYLEFTTATPFTITGDKPFYGYQYLPSQSTVFGPNPAPGTGDPALIDVIAPEQFRESYIFFNEASFPDNFINIVTPVGASLLLDNTPITAPCSLIGTLAGTPYCSIRLAVSAGTHVVKNATGGSKRFGLTVSGFQIFDSYAYPAGLGVDCPAGPQGWMKDEPTDTGLEPNPSTANMWLSDDIWVRNQQDTSLQYQHQHQNPIALQANYVYVKLRNRGCDPLTTGSVRTYFANASTGLAWPANWVGNYPNGDLIGSQPVNFIAANGVLVLEYVWIPPAAGHFCLLARLDSVDDPMTFAEGVSVNTNTRNNNNIVWKNTTVVKGVVGTPKSFSVIVRNIRPTAVTLDLVFGEPGAPLATSFLHNGQITLGLTPVMYARWQRAGAASQGLDPVPGTTSFEIVSPFAALEDVPLGPGEEQPFVLTFEHSGRAPADRLDPFTVAQFADEQAEPDGGVTFVFPVPQEASAQGSSMPLIFTDAVTLEWEDAGVSGADWFNLYRGEVAALPAGDYGTCLQQEIRVATATDSAVPAAGGAWCYLVTGEGAGGEGSLGNQSDGSPRINGAPCP